MDRMSIVRENYLNSTDPQRVKRAFELALKINQRILDKAKAAAHKAGNYNWPFPKAPSLAVQLQDAGCLSDLRQAEKALAKAKDEVPSYTAQWSDEDYEEAYNRAVEKFAMELALVSRVGISVSMGLSQPPPPSPFQIAMSQKIADVLPELTAKEVKFCDGLTYVGDLVDKLDKSTRGFNTIITFKTMDVIRAIPPRWGLEDWIRP